MTDFDTTGPAERDRQSEAAGSSPVQPLVHLPGPERHESGRDDIVRRASASLGPAVATGVGRIQPSPLTIRRFGAQVTPGTARSGFVMGRGVGADERAEENQEAIDAHRDMLNRTAGALFDTYEYMFQQPNDAGRRSAADAWSRISDSLDGRVDPRIVAGLRGLSDAVAGLASIPINLPLRRAASHWAQSSRKQDEAFERSRGLEFGSKGWKKEYGKAKGMQGGVDAANESYQAMLQEYNEILLEHVTRQCGGFESAWDKFRELVPNRDPGVFESLLKNIAATLTDPVLREIQGSAKVEVADDLNEANRIALEQEFKTGKAN